jgi:hypothetical protein
MTDARTDLHDAQLRLAHQLARAGASAADIVAELTPSMEDILLLLVSDPALPTAGSAREHAAQLEVANHRLARDYRRSQERLAAATSDQLAMVLDMDRLRLKVSSAPPPRGLSHDADG